MIDKRAIEKAKNDSSFEAKGWLTFYLVGSAEQHREMAPALAELDAVNLTDGAGGSVYAKVPVEITETEILSCIQQIQALAETMGVEIAVIDLDASTDVEKSKFFTLWLAK